MNPKLFLDIAITPGMSLLPGSMDSAQARAMILAICLQESGLRHRQQVKGPARSYAQFEMNGGIRGVLTHPITKSYIQKALEALDYPFDISTSYIAIEHNDLLCVVYSRLLLYTLPRPLPEIDNPEEGWSQYLSAWRPGKPHPGTWDANFKAAWEIVLNG